MRRGSSTIGRATSPRGSRQPAAGVDDRQGFAGVRLARSHRRERRLEVAREQAERRPRGVCEGVDGRPEQVQEQTLARGEHHGLEALAGAEHVAERALPLAHLAREDEHPPPLRGELEPSPAADVERHAELAHLHVQRRLRQVERARRAGEIQVLGEDREGLQPVEVEHPARLWRDVIDHLVVEARARHSTTNLRNAGRIMREHGIRLGLITTVGGGIGASDVFDQSFYFSNPTLSTFYSRCVSELGYRVGELRDAGPMHTEFTPAPEVGRVGLRDALDP